MQAGPGDEVGSNMAPVQGKSRSEEKEAFMWTPPPPDETGRQRFWRKTKENPFVPLCAGLTVAALTYGLISFKRGDTKMQQAMMRARVVAQGSTVLAIIGGLGYMTYKENRDKQTDKQR